MDSWCISKSLTRSLLLTALAVLVGAGAHAQEQRRLLIPVFYVHPLPGAFDSLWVTELTVTNTSNSPVVVDSIVTDCRIPACEGVIPPNSTIFATPYLENPDSGGRLIPISEIAAEQLVWNLQVRDVSRTEERWGTEIPVIEEQEGRAAFHLQNIPVDQRYRVHLRIYDLEQASTREVLVRYFKIDPTRTGTGGNAEDELLLEQPATVTWNGDSLAPGMARITVPLDLLSADRLRIEVSTQSCNSCLWGMVSISNNETQHVTVVTPN